MPFDSRRLRVQLPCRKAGTVVEADVPAREIWCDPYGTHPTNRCTPGTGGGCTPASPHRCGYDSGTCGYASPVQRCHVRFDTPACYRVNSREPCRYDTPVPECPNWLSPVNCGDTDPCRGGSDPEPCDHWTATNACGVGSTVPDKTVTRNAIYVEADPGEPGTVLIRPGDLPLLRRNLEAEMAQIAALGERRAMVEAQLEDLDAAEKKLKKQAKEK